MHNEYVSLKEEDV